MSGANGQLEIARQKLAETYKMASLGRMLAAVVHEINTPIGCLASNNAVTLRSLEELRRVLAGAQSAPHSASAPPPKAMQIVEALEGLAGVDQVACERVSALVRSLRNFSRADQREIRKTDLHQLIEDTLKLTQHVFRDRIALDKDYGELPEIECYPQSLGQVWLNLLVNAGQAIEGPGLIRVRTRQEGDRVHVAITDSGKGIRPEDQPKIFSSGFTTKNAEEGTGLGLAITRDIVEEEHGGTIAFESPPGAGATFHVHLPLTQVRKNGK